MAINFDNTAFVSDLQKFQYLDKYSRYRYDLGRRESWNETVERTVNHLKYLVDRYSNRQFSDGFWNRIYEAIFNLEVMPAMRMFSIAGEAGKRSGIGAYNCAYMPIKDFDCFKEAVLILMSGTGLGYSVENKYISQFPIVRRFDGSIVHYKFEDTTESWSEGILYAIKNWWIGSEVYFDYSAIRPAGTPLKIKGGRASGSESLEKSLEKIRQIIRDIRNRNYRDNKATSLDIHDIVCSIAECIVSGGVRRSALIALFDKDDQLMLTCKDGENIVGNYQRYCSNNSAVWDEILSEKEVYDFVDNMVNGNTGEPGIFSRLAANNMLPDRREKDNELGLNPCAEIVLKCFEFCNLTSVVGRSHDTIESLITKTELATIIGTIQSLEINFPGLRDDWKINCEKERLLGVDIQGFWDCEVLRNEDTLKTLKQVAIDTNKKYAEYFDINQSVAITTQKPSGNSSILNDTSPGIHARWSKYYIRRAQVQKESPIAKLFMDYAPSYIEPLIYAPDTTMVISFPVESPDSKFKDEIPCIEQCELWKMVKLNYTEHNPSVTITYKQNEIDDLKKWIFENQAIIGGMAFLPYDDSVYNQSPYEKIDKETYEKMVKQMPFIDWSKLPDYEDGDYTTQTLACDSEKCELVYT